MMMMMMMIKSTILATVLVQSLFSTARAFSPSIHTTRNGRKSLGPLFSSDWKDDAQDPNKWNSVEDNFEAKTDWQEELARKKDGSFWSDFEPSKDADAENGSLENPASSVVPEEDESEAWLDTLASLQAEEVEFNMKEAERADKVRQMQEWGFDSATIQSALDVAIDTSLEDDDVDGMKTFRQESYWEDEEDLSLVESHTKVPKDPDTGEPIRSQMVYVDEHTCIGCTNCAMIAQSTFFMDQEHGRARVFQQWGDDDETIEIAIQTCPVDCIHYVPYEELERLEVERRDQNINFKARLVNQQEYGGASHQSGGANRFTAPQQISGNMGARCNNCPSRGCKNCPMYGVGKNPEFEKKEKLRKERAAKRRLQQERERDSKSADL